MTIREVRIDSYFSLPTVVAAELKSWPEFITGEGYSAELANETERISVRLVPEKQDDTQHVLVHGEGQGRLFLSVVGCIAHAMAAHSDSVMLMRWRPE